MKTQFEFTSLAFPEYTDGEDSIKKGIFGRRLAEFLASKLSEAGYTVLGTFPEVEGWVVEIDNEQFPVRLTCCSLSDRPNSFLCTIDPAKAFVRLWFERIPTTHIIGPLGDAVELALAPVVDDLQVL